MVDVPKNPELAQAIRLAADSLGVDPVDIGTVVSYETAGTLDPWKAGPTTKWGQHRGLIQWGEPQRKQYGVTPDMSVTDQMKAAANYLRDAGVKPGHGLLDIYSAVNAGRVGKHGASDAHAGGAPGTVADKVKSMAAHRVRAQLLLDGKLPAGYSSPSRSAVSAAVPVGPVPMGLGAPAIEDDGHGDLIAAAQAIAAEAQGDSIKAQPTQMSMSLLENMRRRLTGGMA